MNASSIKLKLETKLAIAAREDVGGWVGVHKMFTNCSIDCSGDCVIYLLQKGKVNDMSELKTKLQELYLFQRKAFFSNHELYGEDWEQKEEMMTLTDEAISSMIRVISKTGIDYSELEKTLKLTKVEEQNLMFTSLGLMRSQLAEHHKRAYYIIYATLTESGY